MAKKPAHIELTWLERGVALVMRNLGKSILGVVAAFGLPAGVAAYDFIQPALPAFGFQLNRVDYKTDQLGTAVDRLLLIDEESRLTKAQADLVVAPTDTVRKTISNLEKQIKNTKTRLCKANPDDCE